MPDTRLLPVQSAAGAALPTASWRAVGLGLWAVGAGLLAGVATGVVGPLSAGVAASCYLVAAGLISGHWRTARFGAANAVTLARLVGTCWIVALTVEAALIGLATGERLLVIALASVCLVLDGVDGRLARSRGEVSDFGARFDMETDALLLLSMSLVVPLLGIAGWWVVAIAGLRYSYLVASWFVPSLRIPLTDKVARRKTIAVVGQLSLVVAVAVDLVRPGWPPAIVLLVGLACLIWSFAVDIDWQLRRQSSLVLARDRG